MRSCLSTLGIDCSFLDCKVISCKGTSGQEGGGLILWGNDYSLVMSEMVISDCSNYFGGGLQHSCPGTPTLSPVQFSFFHANSATCGKDAYIDHIVVYSSSLPFFLHSFSSGTGTGNVQQYRSNEYLDNWLFQ